MEKNREVRRGSMAAMNGGLSRRRQQRSTNLRDSPEDDGAMELRDRDRKKDRDRDRSDRSGGSSRSKRRRGERLVHGSNRDEADDSSDESLDEEEDDEVEEDASVSGVRLAVAAPNPLASSSTQLQQQQQNQNPKSFPSKPARPPAWKMEEMIGVPVPRKARTSSLKRSQECSGGGSGELLHPQASTSPARPIPSPSTTVSPSPSSSNASVRKKKPISGSKQRPPKISKSSSIQDIEIEVAEVLYGMTRHVPNDAKSAVSSPGSFSPPLPASSQPLVLPTNNLVAIAPKRKRPRLKLDEESQTSSAAKMETDRTELLPKPEECLTSASPSRSEKKMTPAVSPAVENGTAAAADHQQDSTENGNAAPEQNGVKEELAKSNSNADLDEETATKAVLATAKADSPSEEKFSIDLMALPAPLESSERDCLSEPVTEMKVETAKGEMEKPDKLAKDAAEVVVKEKPVLDLQLDLKKQDKDGLSLGCSNKNEPLPKQQSQPPRIDPKQEKKALSASLPLTMPIAAGWPGGFPHFGYMGQVPPLPVVMPMDGSSTIAKAMQPPHSFPPQKPKPKRCATHCYIAQTIHYTQQIARMNSFWPSPAAAAAGAAPIYGAKQHNLNVMPPLEAAILGNPFQGGFPGKSLGPLQDKASSACPPAKEKSSASSAPNSTLIEAQRKSYMLQQIPQPGSSAAPPSMLHGSAAFIFPMAAQPPAAATQSVAAKSTAGIGNATPSANSAAAISGTPDHSAATGSFNYAVMQPNDAQYLAVLQNNGYPFPIPAHVGGGPSPYRGVNPSQAMPFFNGSFYSSPMLRPPYPQQLLQHQQPPPSQQQPAAPSQQGHQNTSTSSGSSSSQKHQPQPPQRVSAGGGAAAATAAGGNSQNLQAKQHMHLLTSQARQLESEAGCEDGPSTTDGGRASQAQKSAYGNFAMSIHPQNFTLISPAAASLPSSGSGGGGGSHVEKQQPLQNQANLTPSQAYAMSFAAFGGPAAAAAAAGAAPGFDFSSMVQNHALFHSLPEAARHHGYQQMTAAAAQAAQNKKSHHEDGKSGGDPGAAGANTSRAEGKMTASPGKTSGGVGQHSLSFGRPDIDAQTSTILGNSSNITEGSSRTLNLIQPPANGARVSTQPAAATPASSSAQTAAVNPALSSLHMQPSQQQQHLIPLQNSQLQQQQMQQQQLLQLQQQVLQQHQQQLHLQQQMSSRPKSSSHSGNNATIYSDRMSTGPPTSRCPQGGVASFPPSIIQGASTTQSTQWKTPGRAATPGPANSATSSSSSAKNQFQQLQQQQQQQLQGRNQQQLQQSLLGPNAHQTHISFGVSSSKAVSVSGQNPSLTSAAAAGTPQNSVSKSSAGGGGNGSPRASSSSKSGPSPTSLLSPALPLQQQTPAAKNSPLSPSNLKSPPSNNRNMTYSHITPAPNSSSSTTKFQPQSQQQQQKQSFHQPQLFFANPYIQSAQSSPSNAANFYQQRQQSQHHSQQSQQQNSTNTSVLSLCPSSLTLAASSAASDSAKAAAAAAGGMKGLTPTQHMSTSFPYMHTTSSSVSLKPAGDQKAASGSDNMHWKPEKR